MYVFNINNLFFLVINFNDYIYIYIVYIFVIIPKLASFYLIIGSIDQKTPLFDNILIYIYIIIIM